MDENKVTKEMLDQYLALHEKITNRLSEVLSILAKEDSRRYKMIPFEYFAPSQEIFRVGGWDGCMGSYDWESESVPTHYLTDENWQEQLKEKLRLIREKEEQERLANEQKLKEDQETWDRAEYERLKTKFENR